MAPATLEKTRSAEPDAASPEVGEDGYPVRLWPVDGEMTAFSLRPYADAERPLYWNPLYPGQQMWWRDYQPAPDGITRVVQKHAWNHPFPGSFMPRNAWEEHMTREWMVKSLDGCANPDIWKGENHPEGPGHRWICECSWSCGNWQAFAAHRRKLRHQESMSE